MVMKKTYKSFLSRFIFSLLFIAGFTSGLYSQTNVEFEKSNFPDRKKELKAALKEIELGDALYQTGGGNYTLALDHYLPAQGFNPNNALLNYKIGKCYFNSADKTESIKYFENAVKLNSTVSPDLPYLLGQAYQLNLKFDSAITEYKAYQESLSPADLRLVAKEITKKIQEAT